MPVRQFKTGDTVNQQINQFLYLANNRAVSTEAIFKFICHVQPELFKKDLSIPVSYQIFSFPPAESLYLTDNIVYVLILLKISFSSER